jgi:hypothetical protein
MLGIRYRRMLGLLVGCLGIAALLALPAGAAAKAKDRNHDRIPDRWERHFNLSLNVNQAHRDQDRDHLTNMAEFKAGDNPRDADSDNDGVEDGDENAGTIQSFDASTGRLVINLFGGDTLSGLVTDQTEIECDNEDSNQNNQPANRDGSNSGPGSENSGPSSEGDNNQGDQGAGTCTTADLTPGATVHEAELQTEGGSAVFEKVELEG